MADINVRQWLDQRHPAYTERESIYRFLADACEGGKRYFDSGNLFKFSPRETQSDYDRRRAQAIYPNLVRRTLGIYRDHVFKEADLLRRGIAHSAWTAFEDDVDRNGAPANKFWAAVGMEALLYGWAGVLVDMQALPDVGRPLTMADVRQGVTQPYFVSICPSEVVDWSLDSYGALNWVHIAQKRVNDADAFRKREETTIHSLYRRDGWAVFDAKGNLQSEGTYDLGQVPFVVARIEASQRFGLIGTSFMEDYAYLNRAIANSLSLRADFLAKNALQILTIQLQAMGDVDDGSEQLVIRNLLEYTGERPPQWVGPDVSGSEYMFRHVEDLLGWMRMLASLQDVDVQTMAPQSGIAKLVDFEQTNAALSAFADSLEEAETQAAQLWFRWQGLEWQDDYVIDYPDSFNVRSLLDEIAQAHQVRNLYGDLSPTLVREYLGELSDRLLDDVQPATLAAITGELEENAANMTQEAVFGGRVRREAAGEPEEGMKV